MAKHTQLEMEGLSLEELKKNAIEEAAVPAPEPTPAPVAEPVKEPASQEFEVTGEVDLGDGSGVQVFKGQGLTELDAYKDYSEKLLEAQRNATKKIQEEVAARREAETRASTNAQAKELAENERYVGNQKFQHDPAGEARRIAAEEIEKRFTERQKAEEEQRRVIAQEEQRRGQAIKFFEDTHPDCVSDGDDGTKNGEEIKNYLLENKCDVTLENLHKAYLDRKAAGLLVLRNEGAHSDTNDKGDGKQRIAEPEPKPTPQRTKKDSIGTQNRSTVTPASTELSEDELRHMPMDKLRELSNKQLAGR